MKAKALEIRDKGTATSVLAVDMNPPEPGQPGYAAQLYLLRRCGHACDRRPNVTITRLDATGGGATNNPCAWGGRTWPVAHRYIINHWEKLTDGDVVDVQFILGETDKPKVSERESAA